MSSQKQAVLLIEDDACISEVIVFALELDCYQVRAAESRDQAVEVLAQQPVDIIIMDLHMPGMGPEDFIAKVRKEHPATHIILLTASDCVVSKANALGLDLWIGKPFELEALLQLMRGCKRKSRSSASLAGTKL